MLQGEKEFQVPSCKFLVKSDWGVGGKALRIARHHSDFRRTMRAKADPSASGCAGAQAEGRGDILYVLEPEDP
jgi:hypothetical protein